MTDRARDLLRMAGEIRKQNERAALQQIVQGRKPEPPSMADHFPRSDADRQAMARIMLVGKSQR